MKTRFLQLALFSLLLTVPVAIGVAADAPQPDDSTIIKKIVRNFRCHIAKSGEVAWWSAILDDCYEWDGNPRCWKDTRWTGVLEKQDGMWVIMQQHFSFAADRVTEEVRAEIKAGNGR